MIKTKKGKYRLLCDYTIRLSISIFTLRVGTILNITQIDKENKHVIGPELCDWNRWDMPVELIEEENNE